MERSSSHDNHHHHHFLLLTFPAQGHINPTLQFAKRLLLTGARVTFVTSLSAHRRMLQNTSTFASFPEGLTFAPFSDGYDDGFKPHEATHSNFLSELRTRGSKFLTDLAANLGKEGRPITCIVYSLVMPWAAHLARNLRVPSALLWIQPATVLDIYYYYFHGYDQDMMRRRRTSTDDHILMELPGDLPALTSRDVPSFFLESNDRTKSALQAFQEQFETLEEEEEAKPWVLVNTFDALEPQALAAISDKLNLIGIGPLLPSAYLDGNDPSDKSFGADLFGGGSSKHYIDQWLNSKADASVVYVSFGSLAVLSKPQMEAIADGLLESGRPFLWVVRGGGGGGGKEEESSKIMDRLEELNEAGLIVPWCSQVEVLSHPSVGCFVTHCGWNSTLEGLVSGVPMVGFPQWSDQPTNAKLIQDVWRTGVRVKSEVVPISSTSDEEDMNGEQFIRNIIIVKSDEIVRCLKLVMEEEESGEEMRKNAKRWSYLARESVKEGGSSYRNIRAFMEQIDRGGIL
ncbi:phloretin 4'-O-glucosyltransferase-like [Telopea speciosissima]|uniref:phloretin 4'-O-glucosyltransferase-like n=1 Tax=Telopea speciosissima TaxID=54955 RepID=UPI001CC3B098|nr:phloretin 4'-O-glucosyltransferase-like [Telopea speciosissima]